MEKPTTKITMRRIDDHMNFEATNSTGNSILMDAGENIGGKGNGVRPMQTLLMGAAGCSSIDVVLILKKMKQTLEDIQVDVTATTVKVDEAKEFDAIHLHFKLYGDLKEAKVEKAIQMSLKKYCSVSKMLEKTAEITSSFEINPSTD